LPVSDVIPAIGVAAASIAFAPVLHAVSPILAISVETLIGCAIVAVVPAHAPSIAIFILFFQNLFVSILSSYIADPSDMEFIKGYNFLACSVMWLVTLGLRCKKSCSPLSAKLSTATSPTKTNSTPLPPPATVHVLPSA